MRKQKDLKPIEDLIQKVNDNGYNIHINQICSDNDFRWGASLFKNGVNSECFTVKTEPFTMFFDSMREVVELAVFVSKQLKELALYPEKIEKVEESTNGN